MNLQINKDGQELGSVPIEPSATRDPYDIADVAERANRQYALRDTFTPAEMYELTVWDDDTPVYSGEFLFTGAYLSPINR